MSPVVEGSYCSLCGKCRSGRARRAQDDLGLIAQVCSRRTCAEIKRILRKASRTNSNTSSLVVEVHHYHHTSHPNEDRLDRTHVYSSELHAESLPKDYRVFPIRSALQCHGSPPIIRGEPPHVKAFTELSENVIGQRLDRSAHSRKAVIPLHSTMSLVPRILHVDLTGKAEHCAVCSTILGEGSGKSSFVYVLKDCRCIKFSFT
ncbi:hypothetical protein GMOD_00004940 [Pyrenophora seminiperda CCB06]|uniref:Uncharacterized protein n=1 Tax=Pyrenophora seminiperda CCB06 TaxID=1302712 RepID=A0A3M7MIA6_9PLEO|nr:hypothetical protein GMOD_00004940 [Pyrenophora seminiperda CCB06]